MARSRSKPERSDAARQFAVTNRLAAANPSNHIGTGLPNASNTIQPSNISIATGHEKRRTVGS